MQPFEAPASRSPAIFRGEEPTRVARPPNEVRRGEKPGRIGVVSTALGRLLRIVCILSLPSAAQAAPDEWAKPLRALGAGDAKPFAALAERKAEKGDGNAQHLLSGL